MSTPKTSPWPELAFEYLKDTLETVQLWAQIVGKIRLVKTPWINHSWHVTLYVSPRGLTTGNIPYEGGSFQIDMDFVEHQLKIIASDGGAQSIELKPRSVADFFKEVFEKLDLMGIEADIYPKPNELDPAIPFAEDEEHKTYDAVQMNLYWQAYCGSTPCSCVSGRSLRASAVRCICFGALLIWRLPASRAGKRHCIRVVRQICRLR